MEEVRIPGDPDKKKQVEIEVADANFDFTKVHVHDRAVTATDVAHAAGKDPPDEYNVLRRLESLELEPLNLREPVLIRENPPEQFFVIKGSELFRFIADGLNFQWPEDAIKGRTIKRLLNKDEEDIEIVVHDQHGEHVLDDEAEVHLSQPGLEHFKSRKAHHPIIIEVDGEPYEAPSRTMTPNEIIEKAAKRDPKTNYLSQIAPHEVSYKDKGDIPIRLHNGESFLVMSIGPMPVSDPQVRVGVGVFIEGLQNLGYAPKQVEGHPECVVIDYLVDKGRYKGTKVRLGFVVPADFPIQAPTGPHVSPEIHPIKADGDHPSGHVHKTHSASFDEKAGGSWQYWSRPYVNWPQSKRNVAAYMSHIAQLWATQ